jgi:hypothetical protein
MEEIPIKQEISHQIPSIIFKIDSVWFSWIQLTESGQIVWNHWTSIQIKATRDDHAQNIENNIFKGIGLFYWFVVPACGCITTLSWDGSGESRLLRPNKKFRKLTHDATLRSPDLVDCFLIGCFFLQPSSRWQTQIWPGFLGGGLQSANWFLIFLCWPKPRTWLVLFLRSIRMSSSPMKDSSVHSPSAWTLEYLLRARLQFL